MPIDFPNRDQWIPNLDQLNAVGEGLRDIAVGALGVYDRAARYDRVYVGHGTEAPVVRSVAKQLTVVCTKLYLGRAGEEQFQFTKGSTGKLAFQTAQFMVELSAPWPTNQGGQRSTAIATPAIDEHRQELWRDGLVVFAAMVTLAAGGIEAPWPHTSNRGEEIAVGPLTAKDPSGTQASWVIQVQVQV